MLFQWFWLCSPLILSEAFAQEDLEIVSSDNHFAYQQAKLGGGDGGETPGYYQHKEDFGKSEFGDSDDIPKIDFPVKTVQKFTDSDGNVKIITSYSNRDDNPLPIYKDVALRQKGLQQARTNNAAEESQTNSKNVPKVVKSFVTTPAPVYASQIEPRSRPTTQEFSTTKTVRLPNQDGQLYANQHETTTTDGRSSSYNQRATYKTNYKKPPLKIVHSTVATLPSKKGETVITNTPLEEAGSSYVSDIDDGRNFDGGSYGGGHGYAGGSSSYSSGGTESDYGGGQHDGYSGGGGEQYDGGYDDGGESHGVQDHGGHYHGGGGGGGPSHGHAHGHSHGQAFKKGHGSSYNHADKGSKGEEGGKGHKSKEQYEKGHSESHGHEEEKGGKKEESGSKGGHLDEANAYAKGHNEAHGSKGSQQGHSKGHKKGHKTKGFRTVHHKDEYKKDEVFYDEEHDAGHHKGHGQDHHSHKHAKGGNTKKGHLNSGYKHNHKGFKGDKEKGHSYKNAKGHSGNHGSKHHNSHHSHFDKAAGHKGAEAHGHEHHSKGH